MRRFIIYISIAIACASCRPCPPELQAGDLLFRQIVKNKSKLADRFKKRAPEIYAEPAAEEPDYSVIKRKHFALKPMHVDEAILQMELLGHNFYMFLNAETEVPNVVYKRNAGGYGLLEPDEN